MARGVLLVMMLLFGLGAGAEQSRPVPDLAGTRTVGQLPATTSEPRDPDAERMKRAQEKRFNQSRYSEIKRDSEKLLELATQLKRYVDHANENTLSLEVVRKAEEIEKLARDVKSRMRN